MQGGTVWIDDAQKSRVTPAIDQDEIIEVISLFGLALVIADRDLGHRGCGQECVRACGFLPGNTIDFFVDDSILDQNFLCIHQT